MKALHCFQSLGYMDIGILTLKMILEALKQAQTQKKNILLLLKLLKGNSLFHAWQPSTFQDECILYLLTFHWVFKPIFLSSSRWCFFNSHFTHSTFLPFVCDFRTILFPFSLVFSRLNKLYSHRR